MGKRSIKPYVRAQAAPIYQSGLNLSKISKQLQVCRCCVRNAITKFEEYTKFDDMERSGRSKSLSDRNIRELKRLVQGDNRLSVAKITTALNVSPFKPVSKRTVRRYLKKLGYEYAVKIKKNNGCVQSIDKLAYGGVNDTNIGLSKSGEGEFLATNQRFTF